MNHFHFQHLYELPNIVSNCCCSNTMKPLPDHTLLKILQNEEKMEEYLHKFGNQPTSIDPIIWHVHLATPAKKRMPILNKFFQQLLKRYSLVFSFLPLHMVLAKVCKTLNVPIYQSSSKISTIDLLSCRRLPKIARFNKQIKVYKSWRKIEKNPDLGIYEYREECPGPFVPYAVFREECKKKKSFNISTADILSQLMSKTEEI